MDYRLRVMVASAQVLALLLGATTAMAESPKDNVSLVQASEKRVLDALARSMTCKSYTDIPKGNLYCVANFRGLEIEFAGINNPDPDGRRIYIHAIGPKQMVSNAATKCVQVIFFEEDLSPFPGGTSILIRDDGTFEGFFENDRGYANCQLSVADARARRRAQPLPRSVIDSLSRWPSGSR